ncbi:hypothetical protein Tco_0352477 [Tanacetum coccineum]
MTSNSASLYLEKINEVQIKALADFEDQFETFSGLLALLPEDLKQLLCGYVVPISRVKVPAGRYVVPTGKVKVPAGRYVVPTGKDNVIVSADRSKVIPAGRTILVLVVLCLLRVDSIVDKDMYEIS